MPAATQAGKPDGQDPSLHLSELKAQPITSMVMANQSLQFPSVSASALGLAAFMLLLQSKH